MEELANSALFGKNQLLDIVCLDNTVWLSSTRNIFKINALNKDILEFTSTDSLQVNMFSKRAFTIDKNQTRSTLEDITEWLDWMIIAISQIIKLKFK